VSSPLAALGGGQIVDLISRASDVLAGRPFVRLNAPVPLSMMLDHIDRHSDDPSLSAATLARKFHCSERYVHKLFSKTGRSVGEHVNHKRILVCTRDLLGDARNRTIAEIAFASGFRDISHFNRLFKPAMAQAPRVSSCHDLKRPRNHGCRALEAFMTVANSLTRSLLRDQCALPDGCVTAHASARAIPRSGRHALPNDVSSE
jgi:AraC-like DNA-binding protein